MSTVSRTLDSGARESWMATLELAMREVFEIMLSSKLEHPESSTENDLEFTAMVGLAGDLCGVFSFRCGAGAAAIIASKMLGVDLKEVDEQAWDAIGEIANKCADLFRSEIEAYGHTALLQQSSAAWVSLFRTFGIVVWG